ncbi:MAG: hypothetical protein Q8O66_01015 [bacterium]|nr:hypothetical protein [bacterium]
MTEEITAAGGFEETIHFLSMDMARPICKKIAEVIVKSDWRIPRSMMERLAAEQSIKNYGGNDFVEYDKRYQWCSVLDLCDCFTVPILRFGDLKVRPGKNILPLSEEILNQIVGKPAAYPMIVVWNHEPHVVVQIIELGDDIEEGKMVTESNRIFAVDIVPVKFFNLEQ